MTEQQLRELYRLTANRTCSALTFVKIGMSMQSATPTPSAPAVDAGAREAEFDRLIRAYGTACHRSVSATAMNEAHANLMTAIRAALSARASEAAAGEPVSTMRDRARWFVRDFSREVGFAMSDAQTEVMLNLFLRYAAHPAASEWRKAAEQLELANVGLSRQNVELKRQLKADSGQKLTLTDEQIAAIEKGVGFLFGLGQTKSAMVLRSLLPTPDSATASDKEGA